VGKFLVLTIFLWDWSDGNFADGCQITVRVYESFTSYVRGFAKVNYSATWADQTFLIMQFSHEGLLRALQDLEPRFHQYFAILEQVAWILAETRCSPEALMSNAIVVLRLWLGWMEDPEDKAFQSDFRRFANPHRKAEVSLYRPRISCSTREGRASLKRPPPSGLFAAPLKRSPGLQKISLPVPSGREVDC